jgi:hypothetical protein
LEEAREDAMGERVEEGGRYEFLRRIMARRRVELMKSSVFTMVGTKGEAKTIFRNPETNQTAAIEWAEPNEAPWSR